jgi:GNAT superfamily N-acetyltransferase
MWWLAREGRTLLGAGRLGVSSWENRDRAQLELHVAPAFRARGVGSALLGVLEAEAVRRGVRALDLRLWAHASSERFAERHGFAAEQPATRLSMDPRESDWSPHRSAAADRAGGYEVVIVDGTLPRALHRRVARVAAALNDSDLRPVGRDGEVFTPRRLRAQDRCVLARGARPIRAIARDLGDGRLVGLSLLELDAGGEYAEQQDTSVVRGHRGRGIAQLMKATMLAHLHDVAPALKTIETWNADANTAMLAVNQWLGFTPVARQLRATRGVSRAN